MLEQAAPGASRARSWVIYMSAITWGANRNRQQELAEQIARSRRVLFVERPGLMPAWGMQVEQLSASLWRARPPTLLPLGRFLSPANRINRCFAAWRLRRWLDRRAGERVLWLDEDLAAPIAGRLRERLCVYDGADLDWTFTRRFNRPHLRRSLRRAVAAADLVTTSSRALADALPCDRRRPVELLNACDPAHFRADGPASERLADIPGVRIGYMGAIDTRAFDADLLAAVARLRPAWSFVLAGSSDPRVARELRPLANIRLLGPVGYPELPALVRGFDVCLIPYRSDGLISYVQPKKFFEYLAAGKPVVTTPLAALDGLDAPHLRAASPRQFVAAIEAALKEPGEHAVAARRRAALENSWQARGNQLLRMLDAAEEAAA